MARHRSAARGATARDRNVNAALTKSARKRAHANFTRLPADLRRYGSCRVRPSRHDRRTRRLTPRRRLYEFACGKRLGVRQPMRERWALHGLGICRCDTGLRVEGRHASAARRNRLCFRPFGPCARLCPRHEHPDACRPRRRDRRCNSRNSAGRAAGLGGLGRAASSA